MSVLRKAVLVLAAAPLLGAAFAGTASADEIVVPGCYGAEDLIVCEPGVEYESGYRLVRYTETYTVCVMTCEDHTVTMYRLVREGRTYACPTYEDRYGNEQISCAITD